MRIVVDNQIWKVVIYTAMEDARKGISKLPEWVSNGFRTAKGGKGKKLSNLDEWRSLYELINDDKLTIKWKWSPEQNPAYNAALEIAEAQAIKDVD